MRLIDADELKKIIKENDALTMTGFSVRLCDIDNTPTIQAVPIDVLDKIRSEIRETIDEERTGNGNINKGVVIGLQMALDTIDKYKAESEDKE